MKRQLIFILMTLVAVSNLSAQPALPAKVKVKLPAILSGDKLPRMDEDLLKIFRKGSKWGQNEKTLNQIWVVYSDRAKNQTYMSPSENGTPCTELGFGQQVCIADIQNDMALIYEDYKANYPQIPVGKKSLGWVPMEKLLLWKKCPTDRRGVLMKAIIAINLKEMGYNEKFQDKKYQNPDNLGASEPLNMDMNYYYIMKTAQNGNYALLCTGAQFSISNLYGWVNKNAYTVWNQRTCLEPNWSPKYVEENKNDMVYVYQDNMRSSRVTQWTFGTSNGDDNPAYKYRMHPSLLRFPVLEQPDNNGMVQCTSFADRSGNSNNAAKFAGNITATVNKKEHEMQQMNVILVVEATTDMSKFLPAIKSALSNCKDYAKMGLKVQVGLVLYRNQDAGISKSDIIPLCNYDDARLLSKLESSQASTRLTGERNVALAKALETAADPSAMGFNKDQSNMVLVIGYHGSDDSSWKEENLLKKLNDNNIQLASVQVMRASSGSSSRYFNSIGSLIKKNVDAQYKSIGREALFNEAKGKDGKKSGDGYIFTNKGNKKGNKSVVLYASSRYNADLNQVMTPEALTRYVNNGINGFSKSVDASRENFAESLKNIDFDPDFLKKKLGEDGYRRWVQMKAISAYAGYAKIKDLGDNDDWHAILYLSSDELKGLIQNLEEVNTAAANENPDRTIFIRAIRELLKRQLGGSVPDKEIDAMKPDEIENAVYGIVNIPSENMRFTKYSLSDLINRKKVTDEEYFEMLDGFSKKYKKLRDLQRNYKYRLEVGDNSGGKMYYYWIPLEDLP